MLAAVLRTRVSSVVMFAVIVSVSHVPLCFVDMIDVILVVVVAMPFQRVDETKHGTKRVLLYDGCVVAVRADGDVVVVIVRSTVEIIVLFASHARKCLVAIRFVIVEFECWISVLFIVFILFACSLQRRRFRQWISRRWQHWKFWWSMHESVFLK